MWRWRYGLCVLICLGGCGGPTGDENAREVAEWVVKQGGSVMVIGTTKAVKTTAAIPGDRFPIERIDLKQTKVRDKDLAKLNGLKHLQALNLYQTAITDKGLDEIKNLATLQTLELSYTRVTDEGLAKLAELPRLTKLYLYGTRVTDDGIAKLKQANTNVEIFR